jgi:hypothetical protein
MIVRCIVSLVLAGITGVGVVVASSKAPWDGGYIGFDLGDGSSRTCSSSALDGVTINPTNASQFTSANCSKNRTLGGLEVGENFQCRRFVWGLGAELDYSPCQRPGIKPLSGLINITRGSSGAPVGAI